MNKEEEEVKLVTKIHNALRESNLSDLEKIEVLEIVLHYKIVACEISHGIEPKTNMIRRVCDLIREINSK